MKTNKSMQRFLDRGTLARCLVCIVAAAAAAYLASVWPILLGELYDELSSGRVDGLASVWRGAAVFGITYFLAEGLAIARRVGVERTGASFERHLRTLELYRSLRAPLSIVQSKLSGQFNAELNQGVTGASTLLKLVCNDVVPSVLTGACLVWQTVVAAPPVLALVMGVYILTAGGLSTLQIRSQNGVREEIMARKNHFEGEMCQTIQNLEVVRVHHDEAYEDNRMAGGIAGICKVECWHHTLMGAFDMAKQAAKVGGFMVVLLLSVYLVSKGRMSAGTAVTVCLMMQQLYTPIDGIYRFLDEIASSAVKLKSLRQVLDAGEDEMFHIQPNQRTMDDDTIEMRNVTVQAPNGAVVCRGVSATFRAGEVVSLEGPNGSGKSSLIKGLMRYFKVQSGDIKVFGKPLGEITQEELAQAIHYMPQSCYFIQGTLRDNLRYGLEREVSDLELIQVLRRVEMWDELVKRGEKDPLSLQVAKDGSSFSGGQNERLVIAQALLHRPKAYICDEVTANLDVPTTHRMLDQLEAHAAEQGAVVVYITHQPEVKQRCCRAETVCPKASALTAQTA